METTSIWRQYSYDVMTSFRLHATCWVLAGMCWWSVLLLFGVVVCLLVIIFKPGIFCILVVYLCTCFLPVSIERRTVSKPSTAASVRHFLVVHCRHMSSQIPFPGKHLSTKVAYVHPVKTYYKYVKITCRLFSLLHSFCRNLFSICIGL